MSQGRSNTRWSGLDLRSLAVFRIGLGIVVLADQFLRMWDLRAFYTDIGILPRATLLGSDLADFWISLHLTVGSWFGELCLLLATAAGGIALLIGWHTRWATLACWVLLNSLHARNPFVNDRGDVQLVLMLFWGFFLPLGAVWSLDAKEGRRASGSAMGLPAAALIIQLSFVYLFAAATKTGDFWLARGDALEYSLASSVFAGDLAGRLLEVARPYLVPLNYLVIAGELFAGLLLLTPFSVGLLRGVAVAMIASFHLAVALLFQLGLFPMIGLCSILALLPSEVWAVTRLKAPPVERPVELSSMACHAQDAFLGLSLALVLVANLQSLTWGPRLKAGPRIDILARILKVEQHWDLFSPLPPINGQFQLWAVDPAGNERLVYRAPATPFDPDAPRFPNHRWRMLLLTTLFPDYPFLREAAAREIARRFAEVEPGESLRYQFMLLPMEERGKFGQPRPLLLWREGRSRVEGRKQVGDG